LRIVVTNQRHPGYVVLCNVEHQAAHRRGAERIGSKARGLDRYRLARRQCSLQRIAGDGLDADHLDL
jgi:hypothetical protein